MSSSSNIKIMPTYLDGSIPIQVFLKLSEVQFNQLEFNSIPMEVLLQKDGGLNGVFAVYFSKYSMTKSHHLHIN